MPKRTQPSRRSRASTPVYRADADGMARAALERFAAAVAAQMHSPVRGGPEDSLRPPFAALMEEVGLARDLEVACAGEAPLPGQIGRPDYAVAAGGVLQGYAELKAPGHGADGARFKGHDRAQFKRFKAIPNLLYTDGSEWALYRGGELTGSLARLSGDGVADGAKAVTEDAARAVGQILHDFLEWKPVLPELADGRIDLKRFAAILAPLCRLLRDDVADALRDPASPMSSLAATWREMLFPDASDRQFADAYAQTVVFALLLGRCEGADPLSPGAAADSISGRHGLLSRALELLTDRQALPAIASSLGMLVRVIGAVPPSSLNTLDDPWLHFYEDFLFDYDPETRKRTGVYYTPVQVVRAQVRLLDEILVTRLGKPKGFVDEGVCTLDPAVGTGTYLLGVIEHVLGRTPDRRGAGAVAGRAQDLADNIYGFELSVGPYAVADLRVSRALTDAGAVLPQQAPPPPDDDGDADIQAPPILLADTLESPYATPLELPLVLRPVAEQRAHALKVKAEQRVLVCLGNPPYGRHEAATEHNKGRAGGWVRWGDETEDAPPLLDRFTDPVRAAGHGVHLKNLYNLYVYFWRWALWKVFEQEDVGGAGTVSFITASSWLDGPAFAGMREHIRRVCDEIWVLDLGGEGRGSRLSENVFAIQTPVAIVMACRSTAAGDPTQPARVRYTRIEGSRAEKLAALDGIQDLAGVKWQDGPDGWQDPLCPVAGGAYFAWPLLSDLMPWQVTGTKLSRTWPIAPDRDTLERRWRGLLRPQDRRQAFRETPDRKVDGKYRSTLTGQGDPTPISELPANAPPPRYWNTPTDPSTASASSPTHG